MLTRKRLTQKANHFIFFLYLKKHNKDNAEQLLINSRITTGHTIYSFVVSPFMIKFI
jgi:hypothetical protein